MKNSKRKNNKVQKRKNKLKRKKTKTIRKKRLLQLDVCQYVDLRNVQNFGTNCKNGAETAIEIKYVNHINIYLLKLWPKMTYFTYIFSINNKGGLKVNANFIFGSHFIQVN